ncbi:FAD:protein FMN transferase [Ureibacillus endophyticus]|nr:FAD:protein FMN transferase [Lysinibacillus endophyticus]
MDTLTLQVMNTEFYISLSSNSNTRWKDHVTNWLQTIEKQWSRFDDNNELSKINKLRIGDTLTISEDLYDCLYKAHCYYCLTDGLFSPYLKKQIESHGYQKSFPFQKVDKTSEKFEKPLLNPIIFLPNKRILKITNEEIDLGGFAKGYIVEKVANWLKYNISQEFGIVDGGGDMKLWSNCEKEWIIGISDPFKEDEEITSIKIKNGAIATSNRVYRSWQMNGKQKHHLLNGQTGEIAISPIVQATVVTNSLSDAEVAVKLCFLQNNLEHQHWLEKHHILSARFIISENEQPVWITPRGKTYVH